MESFKIIPSIILSTAVVVLAQGCGPSGGGESPTCEPLPTEAGVLSCQYTGNNGPACIDFSTDDGWDATKVEAFCSAQAVDTVTVLTDDTCHASGAYTNVCQAEALSGDGTYFAAGVPNAVCLTFFNEGVDCPIP